MEILITELILDFCLPRTSWYIINQTVHVAGETLLSLLCTDPTHVWGTAQPSAANTSHDMDGRLHGLLLYMSFTCLTELMSSIFIYSPVEKSKYLQRPNSS